MGKTALRVTVIVVVLVAVAGAWLGLMYARILPIASSIARLPVVGTLLARSDGEQQPPEVDVAALQAENQQLKLQLQAKSRQVELLTARLREAQQSAAKPGDEGAAPPPDTDAVYKELAGYYSSIKPAKAALVFNELDDDTVIGILQQMEPDTAGQILAALAPARAAVITRKMLVSE
ncbi:MAG: hypothetical protein QHH05_00990 [Syntrophomonadaceae bacterium]|jgi:flagellar motility protein MotE (MotC chaperone)|nr:hypothetical protein [Syntrophomonadaceae bacterium]MDH7497010.1 hypothetical protein [Syntrophomonadaceae bacterium]